MSLLETLLQGSDTRIPLGGLLHRLMDDAPYTEQPQSPVVENQGGTAIYRMISVEGTELGSGSTGTVFRATFTLPAESGGGGIDCVVKFPVSLFEKKVNGIEIKQGRVNLKYNKSPERAHLYKEALRDLESEWHNGFMLHFGKQMMRTKIADAEQSAISMQSLRAALPHMHWLEQQWGYNNIHELLAMDVVVPCLISEHFEMSLIEWADTAGGAERTRVVAQDIMPQVMAGLHYMHHCARMAHMDIKPNNMLCRRLPDQRLHCVLCDFGNAVQAGKPIGEYSGTPGYMAPEVERWKNKDSMLATAYVPEHADAFSFAVSMLHILHPRTQWTGAEGQLVHMLSRTEAESPRDTSHALTRVLSARDPTKRYAVHERLADRCRQAGA